MPAARANQHKFLNAMCLPTAPGCQLDTAATSEGRHFCAALRLETVAVRNITRF
jgi:hypothetical protein